MLNKPITHPTIKSFVYLDIDSRRDKGRSSSFDKSGHSRRHTARSLARSFATRGYACSSVRDHRRKKVYRCYRWMRCARFPNVNLYSVKRGREGGRKKERREEERSRSVEGEKESGGKRARQCTKSRKTHGETLQPGEEGGQKPIMDTMVDGSSLFLSRLCGPSAG